MKLCKYFITFIVGFENHCVAVNDQKARNIGLIGVSSTLGPNARSRSISASYMLHFLQILQI